MKKKILTMFLMIISSILIAFIIYTIVNKNFGKTDSEKFSDEYGITTDNVFVYRTQDEILKILQHGTGIVYLGFPECPWCKAYVKYLNEVAKEEEIDKIYYYNILDDRKNNTDFYKKLLKALNGNLLYDDEGNEKIFVPDVSFVVDGNIIHHDNETSVMKDNITPVQYWTKDRVESLKEKLKLYMQDVNLGLCTSCEGE